MEFIVSPMTAVAKAIGFPWRLFHFRTRARTISRKIKLPAWIEEISPCQIAAVNQGGCASGAYMPAVAYWSAIKTMSEHGDDVLEFLADHDSIPAIHSEISWSGIACLYLTTAVELWCSMHAHLADWNKSDWD